MFAHWQPFDSDVCYKAANSKQYFEDKVPVWMGIERLHGEDLKDRQGTYVMPYGLDRVGSRGGGNRILLTFIKQSL